MLACEWGWGEEGISVNQTNLIHVHRYCKIMTFSATWFALAVSVCVNLLFGMNVGWNPSWGCGSSRCISEWCRVHYMFQLKRRGVFSNGGHDFHDQSQVLKVCICCKYWPHLIGVYLTKLWCKFSFRVLVFILRNNTLKILGPFSNFATILSVTVEEKQNIAGIGLWLMLNTETTKLMAF